MFPWQGWHTGGGGAFQFLGRLLPTLRFPRSKVPESVDTLSSPQPQLWPFLPRKRKCLPQGHTVYRARTDLIWTQSWVATPLFSPCSLPPGRCPGRAFLASPWRDGSRAAAPVCGFSRGTTARSVSLSWGAREVGSPCEWRGGARHCRLKSYLKV